jgi:uncharacterized protein YhbP (UPF0306 family)
MAIARSERRVAARRITGLAADLLDAAPLCAIATVDRRGRAHINTAYFAWNRAFELVWLSEPTAKHSKNLATNETVAIAVYASNQTWGGPDRGIQLFGRAAAAAGAAADEARQLYTARFPRFAEVDLGAYRLYIFRADRLKLFDEEALGGGIFVTAGIAGDRKAVWERTDVYESKGGH